jgi:D-arabinitol 4-dehydrogenase
MPTILHLGLGSFHRAHQAAYLQALIDLGERQWRLVGANLRGDMAPVETALIRQHGRYILETVSAAGGRAYQSIEAIGQVLPFSPDLGAVVAVGADPGTAIISLTVTEGGYFQGPDGALREDAPEITADLTTGSHQSLYGALSLILTARMEAGAGPVTLLSCDNLLANGERLAAGLNAFLTARDEAALLAWCAGNIATPCCMVDRITPRPPPELAPRVAEATGVADAAPVMAEDFAQWVIEDHFAAGRPALERVGVQFVTDVAPYEKAKIRILNASHSAIAWWGACHGHAFIHESLADPAISEIVRAYVDEAVIPSLSPSPLDLRAYGANTLRRFSNPNIRDTTQRVAGESWAKIPAFIAPTVMDCRDRDLPLDAAAMFPALFLRFMETWRAGALPFTLSGAATDDDAARAILASDDTVSALCVERRLWGRLAGDPAFVAAVRAGYRRLSAIA